MLPRKKTDYFINIVYLFLCTLRCNKNFFCHRMWFNHYASFCLIALVLGQAVALPQHPQYTQQYPQEYQQQQIREDRKFAEKPNAMKKVAIDDLEDISTNQIQVNNSLYNCIYVNNRL